MSNSPPLVSVIIPCFNAERYIADAIESALRQTYRPIEIVVVDDGSTDRSLERIRAYQDRVIFCTGPNEGGCAARNKGIAMSSGKFIQFLDADDILYPTKVEVHMASLSKDPTELTYCDWDSFWENRPWDIQRHAVPCVAGDNVRTLLNHLSGILTPCMLHSRDILLEFGGFRVGLPCAQEYELHMRMACRGIKFRRIPEALHLVRRRQGSVCWDLGPIAEWSNRIDLEAFQYLQNCGAIDDVRAEAFARKIARRARWLISSGNVDAALGWINRAKAIHPTGWKGAYGRRETKLLRILGTVWAERTLRIIHRVNDELTAWKQWVRRATLALK